MPDLSDRVSFELFRPLPKDAFPTDDAWNDIGIDEWLWAQIDYSVDGTATAVLALASSASGSQVFTATGASALAFASTGAGAQTFTGEAASAIALGSDGVAVQTFTATGESSLALASEGGSLPTVQPTPQGAGGRGIAPLRNVDQPDEITGRGRSHLSLGSTGFGMGAAESRAWSLLTLGSVGYGKQGYDVVVKMRFTLGSAGVGKVGIGFREEDDEMLSVIASEMEAQWTTN
jgi:hypothetical protein